MNYLWVGWLILGMVFLLIELAHPHWVLFWFAIGAVLAAVLSGSLNFNMQALVFLASSVSLAYIGRPILVKTMLPEKTKTNIETFTGREEEVIEEIDDKKKSGAIKIFGTHWNAKTSDDSVIIKIGTKVKIIDFSGLTAIVEPVKKGEKS